jgi:NAD(P)-dependent dehydrogenase (short-subunit alcohol dehydrogenase family)
MNLTGKRALVTGGAVRIGRAIVEALQAESAEVIVHFHTSDPNAVREAPLSRGNDQRERQPEAKALSSKTIQADLSDPAQ